MYLRYFQLRNYKNFESNKFEFNKGTNVILGENDSGKSNAMKALRILLDDSYYYGRKNLKENDFSESLDNWKGHWIIISAYFDGINSEHNTAETVKDFIPEIENQDFLNAYIKSGDTDYGTLTLYIRPHQYIRKELYEASGTSEFQKIRNSLTLEDYEFIYRSRSQKDFTDEEIYKEIVGDLDNGISSNPEEDNDELLGGKIDMTEVWQYTSVVFIDALRDISQELRKYNNPIKKLMNKISANISRKDIEEIEGTINKLNESISHVDEIGEVGEEISKSLKDIAGFVYSPNISLESNLDGDFNNVMRFISLTTESEDLNHLGLGHLNVLYIALKLVEFKYIRNRELLNIMIIEEPEAHIHVHIQKTLFDNLDGELNYTQVIMTSHSTHISEVSEIERLNIIKKSNNGSIVMLPSKGLEEYGQTLFKEEKNVNFVKSIERYLDTKRSTLLFAKAVILVEGDGEELLIPNMIKKSLGITLDEIGISIVNIGSVSFEYISSLFHEQRIQRNCAILTDLDKQPEGIQSPLKKAEMLGAERKEKFSGLFKDNKYVECFYALNTLEIDFAIAGEPNRNYIQSVISDIYRDDKTIQKHTDNLLNGDEAARYESVMTVAKRAKKGWYAILLSEKLDGDVVIPDYILDALIFASHEMIKNDKNSDLILKMIKHTIDNNSGVNNSDDLISKLSELKSDEKKNTFIDSFISSNPNLMVSKFVVKLHE